MSTKEIPPLRRRVPFCMDRKGPKSHQGLAPGSTVPVLQVAAPLDPIYKGPS